MNEASTAILKGMRSVRNSENIAVDPEQASRFKLSAVAQAFVDLQQARHMADYDIDEPFHPPDAAIDVAQARLAFLTLADIKDGPLAQGYLYSILFKDRP